MKKLSEILKRKPKVLKTKKIDRKKLNFILTLLFILGISLTVWEIIIFRHTIIEVEILFFSNSINEIEGKSVNWVLQFMIHSFTTGAFLLFSFMATNFYLAEDNVTMKSFKIINKGSLAGSKGSREKRKPYVVIDYKGFNKELIFSFKDTETVYKATQATVFIKKGFFGIEVIENYYVY